MARTITDIPGQQHRSVVGKIGVDIVADKFICLSRILNRFQVTVYVQDITGIALPGSEPLFT